MTIKEIQNGLKLKGTDKQLKYLAGLIYKVSKNKDVNIQSLIDRVNEDNVNISLTIDFMLNLRKDEDFDDAILFLNLKNEHFYEIARAGDNGPLMRYCQAAMLGFDLSLH